MCLWNRRRPASVTVGFSAVESVSCAENQGVQGIVASLLRPEWRPEISLSGNPKKPRKTLASKAFLGKLNARQLARQKGQKSGKAGEPEQSEVDLPLGIGDVFGRSCFALDGGLELSHWSESIFRKSLRPWIDVNGVWGMVP
jgi:hypothetical protein